MFKHFLHKLKSARYYAIHQSSRRSIEDWQLERLRTLVTHASKHIPFYKDLSTYAHLRPESLKKIGDITQLPILTKDTFRNRPFEEYIDSSRTYRGIPLGATSGTTGKPFVFVGGTNLLNFQRFRFLLWQGITLHNLSKIKYVYLNKATIANPYRLSIPGMNLSAYAERTLNSIENFRPLIIESMPTILLRLVEVMKATGHMTGVRPTYIVSFGEMLSPHARRIIEAALGAKVYDRYGIDEAGVIGIECAFHDGFHINVESIIAEVVSEDGTPLADGGYGKILVTDLNNFHTPFIRYDTGDYGKLLWKKCRCGLESPRLWVQGRYSAYLVFGQNIIHHEEFSFLLTDFSDQIIQYQIAKLSDALMEVRLIATRDVTAAEREEIQSRLGKLAGEKVEIRVRRVESIPSMESGKLQTLIDESVSPEGR
jgi:phenylacetate-CoA ligase